MSKETWHGIPRSKIPWFPTIDYQKCISCGKCEDYCKLGAYELEEHEGKKRAVVKHPNNCVVLCTGCNGICPAGAIKHQPKKRDSGKNQRAKKDVRASKEQRVGIGVSIEENIVCLR